MANRKAIKMINQLIADYENTLCTEEMNLVVGFYNTVGDFDAAMVLCEKLSAKGYGKSLNKANKSSTAAVSEYISKYQIADITGTSVEYIEALPFDIQDELLDCYESDSDNKNLFKILDLEYKPEKVEVKNNQVKKRPSLLKKLRYYQNLINRQEQQNN